MQIAHAPASFQNDKKMFGRWSKSTTLYIRTHISSLAAHRAHLIPRPAGYIGGGGAERTIQREAAFL